MVAVNQESFKNKFEEAFRDALKMVQSHPKEDQEAFAHLLKTAFETQDEEEREECIVSMGEILSDAPGNTHVCAAMTTSPALPQAGSNLAAWSKFVGTNIKRLREERGWTQEQLAMQVDMTQSYISRIEQGMHSPTFKTISRLAQVFGVSPGKIDPVLE